MQHPFPLSFQSLCSGQLCFPSRVGVNPVLTHFVPTPLKIDLKVRLMSCLHRWGHFLYHVCRSVLARAPVSGLGVEPFQHPPLGMLITSDSGQMCNNSNFFKVFRREREREREWKNLQGEIQTSRKTPVNRSHTKYRRNVQMVVSAGARGFAAHWKWQSALAVRQKRRKQRLSKQSVSRRESVSRTLQINADTVVLADACERVGVLEVTRCSFVTKLKENFVFVYCAMMSKRLYQAMISKSHNSI